MHILRVEQSGDLYADGEAVDLNQPAARAVILTAADSDIFLLSQAVAKTGRGENALRLANILSLTHPFSIDLYVDKTLRHAKFIMARLLGGASYWSYGCETLAKLAREYSIPLALVPGDGRPDPELDRLSTLPHDTLRCLAAYGDHGGIDNAIAMLGAIDDIIDGEASAPPPKPLLKAGLYWPQENVEDTESLKKIWVRDKILPDKIAAVVFYRAFLQAGQTAPIDALIKSLTARGVAVMPIFTTSLKDTESAAIIAAIVEQVVPAVIINATGFAVSNPGMAGARTLAPPPPFDALTAPIIQVMMAGNTEQNWVENAAGLSARDLAMNVVLPELDGRIISSPIAFKTEPQADKLTHAMIITSTPHQTGIDQAATLADGWLKLNEKPRDEKRLALILANYPNKDGRLANGVGLDTPASLVLLLEALIEAGYRVDNPPATTTALMDAILAAPTNSGFTSRKTEAWFALDDYRQMFADLPQKTQDDITKRWGEPQDDPMVGVMPQGGIGFALPVLMRGHVVIAIQPARGYNIDPVATFHSPDLPPPHNYLAFYLWCRHRFGADAVIHLGKHGNLEWLPGKALALSASCFPEACLGQIPNFYPFIVNDPGEGSQAKRRMASVVIDHLTPPMTLADSYGVMAELEMAMDEYYEAAAIDKRRSEILITTIIDLARRAGLAEDCGINQDDLEDQKLIKLDNFLCEVKEMQIRDGLHIFGRSPDTPQRDELITAILRVPRGGGEGENQSILRALSDDLRLGEDFDPLTATRAEAWHGKKPQRLASVSSAPWRSIADTVERLNIVAGRLIQGSEKPEEAWQKTATILTEALPSVCEAVVESGACEITNLMRGLDGHYVPAGASGAPTRGRPEVLPTGRNFFSIDIRAVPTPAAWKIGWASAGALIDRYLLDHGNYPTALVLSVWGTANMRTGGDDLAQALALIGVKPEWDSASRRVTGFEVIPLSVLGRPRVDVTLRTSGFFRDAFPAQIALYDKAIKMVASLDESPQHNPMAARITGETEKLIEAGFDQTTASRQASFRVFSAPPGAYGAGLQTLIDEKIWSSRDDFADAFLTWGSYAYGDDSAGTDERDSLVRRLTEAEAVIHNQDNREHDILDSDDYYQFAGGLAATVASLKGQDVPVYMSDHALAERPVIRSLAEEIARVVRGRAANPKWLKGVMRHGYKGAFEIAATLDYLFAFAATTRQVPDHHFDALFSAWIDDQHVANFIQQNNIHAWDDILDRFQEAMSRGLWQPQRNSIAETLEFHRKKRDNTAQPITENQPANGDEQ